MRTSRIARAVATAAAAVALVAVPSLAFASDEAPEDAGYGSSEEAPAVVDAGSAVPDADAATADPTGTAPQAAPGDAESGQNVSPAARSVPADAAGAARAGLRAGDDPVGGAGDDPSDDPGDDPSDDPGDDPSDDPGDDPSDDPGDDPSDDPTTPDKPVPGPVSGLVEGGGPKGGASVLVIDVPAYAGEKAAAGTAARTKLLASTGSDTLHALIAAASLVAVGALVLVLRRRGEA